MVASRICRGRAAAVPAGLGLLLAAALTGCSAAQPGAASAAPAAARGAPARTAAADSFHSTRTYRTVALPVRVRIPAASVDSPLEQVGLAADGTMALPVNPELAGWYRNGPRPGQPGPAVIIGHVDWGRRVSVFFYLTSLRRGDPVYVDRADGSTARFRVTGRTLVAKSRFPTDLVYGANLNPSLRLVTCGGSLNSRIHSYRDNVIVFAVPG